MSDSIYRINSGLSLSTKISLLNSMILEISGNTEKGLFSKNEMADIYAQFATLLGVDRKFLRDVSLGHTLSDYINWSHYSAQTGYSIWKLSPTNYIYNVLNQLYFDDILLDNRGEALSEALTGFDKVYLNGNESGLDFTDNTTESATENGTEFPLMAEIDDYLYVGLSTKFSGIDFQWQTRGSNYTNVVEYYNGSSWTTLTANINNLVDDTQNFISNGIISFDQPSNWATTTINSITDKYWIRISTTTVPTTTAKAYLVVPANSVISLLALSAEEFQKEQWAWCSYGTSIYVTIKNQGGSAYQGDAFITSASSEDNKQDFFIYSHEFSIDHEDSTYVSASWVYTFDSTVINNDLVCCIGERDFGLADANDSTKPAIAVVSDIDNDVLIYTGKVTVNTVGLNDIGFNDVVYLSATAGKVTKTPPESGGQIVQVIGRAIADEISGGTVQIILGIQVVPTQWL